MADVETWRTISNELSIMNLPPEDLTSIINLNSEGGVPEEGIPHHTLIQICAHGMTYGAMRTRCPSCKFILYMDGRKYECIGMSFMQSTCNYFRYCVKTSNAPWEIPENIPRKKMLENMMEKKSMNYRVEPLLNHMQQELRNNLILDIDMHKINNKVCNGTIYKSKGITYSYFLVMNEDLIGNHQQESNSTGTSSHCFGQIFKIAGKPPTYAFYKKEKVLKRSCEDTYRFVVVDEAIKKFKSQFHAVTGNTLKSWLEGKFIKTRKNFFPLETDFYSSLPYLTAKEIDDIHEECVVQLKYLKKLKINEKEITELSIKDAKNITTKMVTFAHPILKSFKKHEKQGTEQETCYATKQLLEFLNDEERLKFGSIVSRLLTPPVDTTIRLVDLPQKFLSFEPIGKILSVFFIYQKLKQEWENSSHTWPSGRKLTQEYMLDMTRGIIGSWVMKLAVSPNEKMHHYYVKQKDSDCCYWSVLLRIAKKTFDNSSSDCFVLCTIDVEEVPEYPEGLKHDMTKDKTHIDKQTDIEEIFLGNIDESFYNKCGYIQHSKSRAKMVMVFPIKYNVSPEETNKPSESEEKDWIDFTSHIYSAGKRRTLLPSAQVRTIINERSVPLIYLGEADEISWQKIRNDYFGPQQKKRNDYFGPQQKIRNDYFGPQQKIRNDYFGPQVYKRKKFKHPQGPQG